MDDSQEIAITSEDITRFIDNQIIRELRHIASTMGIETPQEIADYLDDEILQEMIFNIENK